MSRISALRVFKALLESFIDISQPLLKYFVREYCCLFHYAIPRMLCFHFRSLVLPLLEHITFTIDIDK